MRALVSTAAGLLLSLSPVAGWGGEASPDVGRTVMGWREPVVVEHGTQMDALLDAGAETSHIRVRQVEHVGRGEESWVRFALVANGAATHAPLMLDKPLVRMTQVEQRAGAPVSRPVVSLAFCLDGARRVTEFVIEESAEAEPAFVLGRDFLRAVAMVDPDAESMTRANLERCPPHKPD